MSVIQLPDGKFLKLPERLTPEQEQGLRRMYPDAFGGGAAKPREGADRTALNPQMQPQAAPQQMPQAAPSVETPVEGGTGIPIPMPKPQVQAPQAPMPQAQAPMPQAPQAAQAQAPQAQLAQAIEQWKQQQAPQQAPQQALPEAPPPEGMGAEAWRTGKYALQSGLTALPGLLQDVDAWAGDKLTGGNRPKNLLTEGARSLVNRFREPEKPKTAAGRYVGEAGAGVLSALMNPGSAVTNAVVGGLGGLGAEGAADVFGDNPISRVLGGLAGGGVGSAIRATKTNRGALATEAMYDVSEEELLAAKKLMVEARKLGIKLTLAQALGRNSNLDAYEEALVGVQQGKELTKNLREQPSAIIGGLEHRILNKLPGEQYSPRVISDNAQEASTGIFQKLNKDATKLWEDTYMKGLDKEAEKLLAANSKPGTSVGIPSHILEKRVAGDDYTPPLTSQEAYKKANTIPADVMSKLDDKLYLAATEFPKGTEKYKILMKLRDRLIDEQKGHKKAFTDARRFNMMLKDFTSKIKPKSVLEKGYSIEAQKLAGKYVQEIRDDLGASMAPFKKANAAYSSFREAHINPLKKGIIGDLAGKGAQSDKSAPSSTLMAVFDKGTVPSKNKTSEILEMEKAFRDSGRPEVFQEAAKYWLATHITKARESNTSRIQEQVAKRVTTKFGVPNQSDMRSRGFRDVLEGLGLSQGQSASEARLYAKGFQNYMQIVAAAAKRPSRVSGGSAEAVKEEASESWFKRLGQFSPLTPLRQPVLRWSMWLKKDSLAAMDRMLSSPEGVDMLIELGKKHRIEASTSKAMATFFSANASYMQSPELRAEREEKKQENRNGL